MKLKEIYGNKDVHKGEAFQKAKPVISFEVFPPKGGSDEYPALLKELELLRRYNPALVSLTWGAGGNNNNSFELIKIINEKFNLMPHFTCVCNSCENVANHIKDIDSLNIDNILALRGDEPQDIKVCHTDFRYADELVRFIKSKSALSVAVAGYPEGHIEAPSLEADIQNLKKKVDEGAEAIYTQLFFDNEKFYSYIERVNDAGIKLPIVAGIMPILSMNQVMRMTSMAKISVPSKLMCKLEKYRNSPSDMKKFGVDFASEQCSSLISYGVDGLHFFTLNKAASTMNILDNIGDFSPGLCL